jgi:hypothetical protein
MKSKNYSEQASTPFISEDRDVLGQPTGNNVLQKDKHNVSTTTGKRMKTKPLAENELSHHRPFWTGIHHSWIFWVFVALMFAGITYYVVTVDFAFAPHRHPAGTERMP